METNADDDEFLPTSEVQQDNNSDFGILEDCDQSADMSEEDVLEQICTQILDKIEFEHVPPAERNSICRMLLESDLLRLKEGRITYLLQPFTFHSFSINVCHYNSVSHTSSNNKK